MDADIPESAIVFASRFTRARIAQIFLLSAALLIPCLWHRHLEAGDLGSHTYNAWLAELIEHGQAPGLSIAVRHTNVVVDVALERLGAVVGFGPAEKIVASGCVLVFFWGAFALIGGASRRTPWTLVPAIAMVAYGWTFQMGFLNYYLSLGLVFFAIALIWRGSGIDWVVGLAVSGIALLAHPLGCGCLAAVACYIKLAERADGAVRWAVLLLALLAIGTVHFYVLGHFRTQYWDASFFYAMSGADQLVLFGAVYRKVALAAVIFGSCCFLVDFRAESGTADRWRSRTSLEVWAILLFASAMLPELLQLPQYASPVGFLISRLTSLTAVMGLCVLGSMKPRKWHLIGFSAIAAAFFLLVFADTGTLNNMEMQAEHLVSQLPYRSRVIARIEAPPEWRVSFIGHLVDRACIGRCFAYSNYEAASGQFRIVASSGNGIVSDSPDAVQAMESGEYVVRRQDLPMTLIYQCGGKDWKRLCRSDLAEGERIYSLAAVR